jgi:polar amino acid transport system substrate-binding protein
MKGADAVMALKQSKIDAVIIDDQPAKVFAEQNDDITVLPEPFTVEDYAIAISKDKPELTAAFNTAIQELKADGTLDAIVDHYINQTEGSKPYESPAGITYPNGKLIMCTNAAFPPYEMRDGDKVVGLDADFAKAICDKLGYDLQIDDIEFDALIVAVQSGKADFAAAGMTVTEDRLKSIDFTESYYTGSQVIIVKK